jgi:hypothetical protein
MRDAALPLVSLRSPLPLLVAGLGVTLLVIALVTLPPRQPPPDPTSTEQLTHQEALSIVAHDMRSGESATRVLTEGDVRFNDGTWLVSVGDAQFHFTQRNRIVVADNPAAIRFQFSATN